MYDSPVIMDAMNATSAFTCRSIITDDPTTERLNNAILFGHECAWNPDNEFKGFVKITLKTSGYDLLEFGYE